MNAKMNVDIQVSVDRRRSTKKEKEEAADKEKEKEEKDKKQTTHYRPQANDPIAGLIMCSGLPIFHVAFAVMLAIVRP